MNTIHALCQHLLTGLIFCFQLVWLPILIVALVIRYIADGISFRLTVYVIPFFQGLYDRITNAPINRWEISRQAWKQIEEALAEHPKYFQRKVKQENEESFERFFDNINQFVHFFK